MRGFFSNPLVRGLAIIAVVSAGIVLLSLESALVTASALLRIAFLLAIAFFLFLVWRERRSEIATWPDLARWTFYGAVLLAVADVAMMMTLSPNGPEAVAGIVVLAACAYAIFRTWRSQQTLA